MPITHALFAEHSDITDVILKTANVGFFDLVNNPKAAGVLKSFIVSRTPSCLPDGRLPMSQCRSHHRRL
jgi:hypothetical protein